MRLSRDEATVNQARVMMTRQLEQMVHLVEDLLDVNRISSGKLELRLREVDLGQVLSDAVETSRPMLLQKKQHLDLELPRNR
jgi:signal transduction histidine kinase